MTFPTMTQVAGHLAAERNGQGLTNKDLAAATGISPRMVAAKLEGERPISTGDLARLTEALGTTPGQVYTALA
ncbi:helix-turn-helix domain-containing protein [Arthrobacter sp. UYCu723]